MADGADGARVALITGTSGQIGGALARHWIAAGWTVLGLDRTAPEGHIPGLVAEPCELADGEATARAVGSLVATHGVPSVVVNCAGRIANAPLVGLTNGAWQVHDFALWQDVLGSSLTAAFHVTALTVKHMLDARARGVVINVSSISAAGNPGQAAYSAAKAGLNGLTMALAKELGPLGIRVVGLAPGYLDTSSMHENVPASRIAKITGAVPLRRLGTLDDFMGAVDFIVANAYVTGTVIELDGGLVL